MSKLASAPYYYKFLRALYSNKTALKILLIGCMCWLVSRSSTCIPFLLNGMNNRCAYFLPSNLFDMALWFLALFVMLVPSTLFPICSGQGSIVWGDIIRGNDTLISAGGSFAMGFFSPGNSSKSYLGIWYNTITSRTAVWVANRNSPLDSSGVLTIGRDGNLEIFNEKGEVIWSSNASVTSVLVNSTIGVLMDNGNLVLTVGGQILWQSFDHPSDSLLSGMKIGFNLKTGQQKRLISWAGIDDPKPGNFSLGLDPKGHRQLIILKEDHIYWRSNVVNGNGGTSAATFSESIGVGYYRTFSFNEDEAYYSFSTSENSVIYRSTLDPSGKVMVLHWQDSNSTWQVTWQEPIHFCDFYSQCGLNAVCDRSESLFPCQCLPTFVPKLQKAWDSGNFSSGCVRQVPLHCGNSEGFSKFEKMKLPDYSVLVGNMSANRCESICLHNCSCTAFAYASLQNVSMVSCLNWFDDLIDLVHNHISGQDLYIRFNGSTLGKQESHSFMDKKKWRIVIASMVSIIFLISISGYFLIRKWKRMRKKGKVVRIMAQINNSIAAEGGQNNADLVLFSFKSILAATNNFSDAKKLGEGGYGPVYKGNLADDQVVAIKRLSMKSGQGLEEFINELRLIANFQHRYLVRLLGCCVERDENILIYEYLPNRSLDKFLFGAFSSDPWKNAKLDWGKRFKIIEGIAQGLIYIHNFSRLKVIHRDLKASNILLDEAMNPKISDFGMARIFGLNQAEARTKRVVGTYGYMSPEYAFFGKFSEKSDVFSFGVLMLEIVSGRRNANFQQTELSFTLLSWAWELWKEGKAIELIDTSIRDMCFSPQVMKCICVALLCVQEAPGDRPTMSLVIHMLCSDNATLPSPKQPAFYIHATNSCHQNPENFSNNEVTISLPRAR